MKRAFPDEEPSPIASTSLDFKVDAEHMHEALSADIVDKQKIIDVFAHRTAQQRKKIVEQYGITFKGYVKNLIESKLQGDFKTLLLAMCHTTEEVDAMIIKQAMHPYRTDQDALIRVYCSRTNNEIDGISAAFRKLFSRNIHNELSYYNYGDFSTLLAGFTQRRRKPNRKSTKIVCRELVPYVLHEKPFETLFNLLVISPEHDVRETIQFQEDNLDMTFNDILTYLVKDDTVRHAFSTLAYFLTDRPAYFAQLIRSSSNIIGLNKHLLNHTILVRNDNDMEEIKLAFQRHTGDTLANWIRVSQSVTFFSTLGSVIMRVRNRIPCGCVQAKPVPDTDRNLNLNSWKLDFGEIGVSVFDVMTLGVSRWSVTLKAKDYGCMRSHFSNDVSFKPPLSISSVVATFSKRNLKLKSAM